MGLCGSAQKDTESVEQRLARETAAYTGQEAGKTSTAQPAQTGQPAVAAGQQTPPKAGAGASGPPPGLSINPELSVVNGTASTTSARSSVKGEHIRISMPGTPSSGSRMSQSDVRLGFNRDLEIEGFLANVPLLGTRPACFLLLFSLFHFVYCRILTVSRARVCSQPS